MTAEQVAREHYEGRRGLTEAIGRLASQIWSKVSPDDLDASWAQYGPQLVIGVAGAQLAAARPADGYVDDALGEQGSNGGAPFSVNPSSLAGVASDGRPLDSLLQNAVTVVKAGVAGGATIDQAMAAGYANLDMLVRTQVADAGRAADQVALVAHPAAKGYVRMVVGRTCGRCIVLAGRFYRWNAGFDRHPRCDCVHVPAAENNPGDIRTDPRKFFDSLGRAEQDKQFTKDGAQAIRDGADIGQVVNARRGAAGLAPAGARVTAEEARLLRGGRDVGRLETRKVFGQDLFVTTEGTTTRGVAGVRLGARENGIKAPGARYRTARPPRLMPESIYKIAGNDRDEAIRLLRRNGYLTDAPRLRLPLATRPAAPVRVVRPAKPAPVVKPAAPAAKPVPAAPRPSSLGDRVKAGIVDRRVLSGGQNAKTELLTLADGSKVVFKKAKAIEGVSARAQQDAEELVPLALRAAGLRAPEIYRPTANQLYMEYFEGTVANKRRAAGSFAIDPAAYDADQGLLMGLVDQVTDNYDRNGGNWLIGANGEALGIDHGFAFTFYSSKMTSAQVAERAMLAVDQPGAAFHGDRVPHIGEWVGNDMSPADLAVFRSRLMALRPEFVRLGHGDWHDNMLIRLEQIENHATGTKRRIR